MTKALRSMIVTTLGVATLAPAVAFSQDQEDSARRLPGHVLIAAVGGLTLETKDGLPVGDIDDLIVDTETNRVAFAIVSTGGFLGIGDQLTAVPYEVVGWRQDGDALRPSADITKRNLEMAPKYEHDRLRQLMASDEWRRETRAAFKGDEPGLKAAAGAGETPAVSGAQARVEAPARWRRASEMTGAKIMAASTSPGEDGSPAHETFGEVDDLVVHLESRAVVAAVVSRGGIAGIDEDRHLIPFAALERAGKNGDLRVNRSMDEMKEAPQVEKDVTARLDNPGFRAKLSRFYRVELDG